MKTIHTMIRSSLAVAAVLAFGSVHAQMTPVGLWQSIDDKTGEAKGEIRIVDVGGVLSGKLERSLKKDARPDDTCEKCTDDRKDKPMTGLELIRDAKKADGKDIWTGGTIVDPDNGTVYKLKMTPIDGGKKLEVRGFIGFALLGRTQTWIRVQ